MKDILNKKIKDNRELFEYYLNITALPHDKELPSLREERELMKLAMVILKHTSLVKLFSKDVTKIKFNLPKVNKNISSKIKSHLKKFGWINTRHFLGEPWREEDFLRRLKELVESDDINERFLKQKELRLEQEQKFQEAINKLKFDEKNLKIVSLIRRHVYLRPYRKELMGKVAFQIRQLFYELGKRMGLSYVQLVNLTVGEVREFLEKGTVVDLSKIKEREDGYAYVILDGDITLITGKSLALLKKEIEKEIKEWNGVLKGQIANMGKVQGYVKVISDKSELNEVRFGNILVADMTNPEFATVINKCSAIVTDKGGILCHAAIFSREVGIPCIVATEIATKVLKDGDKVEVDALNGIIRKIQ